MRRIFIVSAGAVAVAGLLSSATASSCCAAKSGGGPRVGAFTGTIPKPADFLGDPHADTTESFGMLYGYYGNSWSPDGHSGDALGTGGKLPLFFALNLSREQSVDNPVVTKGDMRVQYNDFGYIPTWRANTVAGSGKFRLTPALTAVAQLVYGGDPGKPGTNSNGAVGVGEVSLQWAPLGAKNFWIRAGNLLDYGTYSPLFDQSPIENYIYTGLVASFAANAGNTAQSVSSLSFGGNFLNGTLLTDDHIPVSAGSAGFYRSGRQRTYLYAKTSWLFGRRLGVKLVGGIQALPEDSTLKPVIADTAEPYYRYRGAVGGMGGIEATIFSGRQYHTLVLSVARGDAAIGSSAPDYTVAVASDKPLIIDRDVIGYDPYGFSFTRDRSVLFNAIYWNGIERGALRLSAGAWYAARLPAEVRVTYVNPMNGALRAGAADARIRDSLVPIGTEPFHSFKISLFPSVQIGRTPLFAGVRYDNITFLTPDAHANAIEPSRDRTLRAPAGSDPQSPVYAPSRWDREAVNANILAPVLRLDFGERGGISAMYALGFYDEPVDRQGRISRVHGNLTIGADLAVIYRKGKKLFP